MAAFVQQGKTHFTVRGGRPRHCTRGVDTLRGPRPVERARRPPTPPRAPPALLMTEEVTGVVISEACEEDITAIAQLSMDAFYGRPWKMGRALPWIASEKTGLGGAREKIQLLLAQYQSPPGDHYVGYEYVWTRKQVSAPSASDLSCTICSRRSRAAAMRFSQEARARAPTLHISVCCPCVRFVIGQVEDRLAATTKGTSSESMRRVGKVSLPRSFLPELGMRRVDR